jgi:hypothetical protein
LTGSGAICIDETGPAGSSLRATLASYTGLAVLILG